MATGTWNVDASGNWSLATNWLSNTIADGATFTANFTNNITATRTVTLDTVRTIGNMTFSDNGAAGSAWVLSGASVLTLDNGVSSPSLNVITSATISAPITGTAGFTKAGAGTLALTNAANNFGTNQTITVNAGDLATNASMDSFGTAKIDLVNSGSRVAFVGSATVATSPNAYKGNGAVAFAYYSPVTFSDGQLAQLIGTTAPPNGTNTFAACTSGLTLYANGSLAANKNCIANVNDLPYTVVFTGDANAATVTTAVNFNGQSTGNAYPNTTFYLSSVGNSAFAWVNRISANQTVGGGLTIGNVTRANTSSSALTMTLTLDGTSAFDNTVSGTMSQLAGCGTLAITKSGTTKWILSGTNSYTGTTSISAGTLSAQSALALGGSGAVTTSSTGVLDISGGVTLNKATRTLTLGSSGNPQLSSTTGSNQLDIGSVVLSTNLLVSVAAGAYLKLNNTAAMTGVSSSATKTGDGEFDFGTFGNQFSSTSGTVTVSAGTASFGASILSGSASPLGQSTTAIAIATATLKYNGTGTASVTRAVSLSGSPSFDASGTGAGVVTLTPLTITHAAGARTITLTGSSTNDNTFNKAIANNGADAVSLTKTGVGKWLLSVQPTYSGLTTVSAGELQFSGLNLSNNLTVNGTGKLSNTIINGVTKTITCDGGTPEIVATTAANTVSGTSSVTAGTLRLTTEVSSSGKPVTVLGSTAVAVSAGATIQTTTGTQQRGQMRYGGNLTFNGTIGTPAVLKIGG